MVRKSLITIILGLGLFLCSPFTLMAAPIYVLPNSSSGWQTFEIDFSCFHGVKPITTGCHLHGHSHGECKIGKKCGFSLFPATISFVVSDFRNMLGNSYLLIDNVRINNHVVAGFEKGWDGFKTHGKSCDRSKKFRFKGNKGKLISTYHPSQGKYMVVLDTIDGYSGTSTKSFGGTDGAYISLDLLSLSGKCCSWKKWIELFKKGIKSVSFDWLFATTDSAPNYDFALVSFHDSCGNVIAQEKLAQVAPVPLPGAIYLLGFGLLGLVAIRRKT